MDIEFGTRRKDAPDDARDKYTVNLRVRTGDDAEVDYAGTIQRRQTTKPEVDKERNQKFKPDLLQLQIIATMHPLDSKGQRIEGKSRHLGTISGSVILSKEGRYDFRKLEWTSGLGGAVNFEGHVQGKKGEAGAQQQKEIDFDVDGERVPFLVKKPDPMVFLGLRIPSDNGLQLPETGLRGELTFDYDKSSYLTNNLAFEYGKTTDRVQGTILWKKEAEKYTHGKKAGQVVEKGESRYVFGLLFNPKKAKEAAQGRLVTDEIDLLSSSAEASTLTGEVIYWDDGPVDEKDGETFITPHHSKVEYRLHAKRLTLAQVHNFLKMWLLMSGPVNDE
jgi:hypothetical protein